MAPAQDRTPPLSDQIKDHDTMDHSENGREQAKIRCSWFANAEQVDKIRATDLGILGYLPWELRQQILTVLIPQPPIDYPEFYFKRSIFKNRWAFDGWAFRPLGSAVMPLWHSQRSLLASHHDTRVTSRFDNLEQFGQCGRFELRPYFSTCEPRFDCHPSSDIFLAVPEDDVVQTFSDRDIIDVRPEEHWSETPFLHYGGAGDATIGNLRQASKNLRDEFDSGFFATHNFFVDSLRTLELFCTSPTVLHAQCQGRISIMVPILSIYEHDEAFEKARMEHWYAALESLPSNLKSLAIYLRYRRKTASGWNKHFQRLDRILNKAKRYAPGARIMMGLTYVHKDKDHLSYPDSSEDAMIRGIRNLIQDYEPVGIERQLDGSSMVDASISAGH
jgi:hypothetical protein